MPTRVRESRGQEMVLTAAVAVVIVLLSLLPMLRLIKEIVAPGGTLSTVAIAAGLRSPASGASPLPDERPPQVSGHGVACAQITRSG